jgi:hypothetical protein
MGWFRRRKRVEGTAQVVAHSPMPHKGTSARCNLTVVVQAPGIPAQTVECSTTVSVKKWPRHGQVLPVDVDPDDPSDLKVLWDRVVAVDDVARQQGDAIARSLDDGRTTVVSTPGTTVHVVSLDGREPDPASLRMAEQIMGVDLDQDGTVGDGSATPSPFASLFASAASTGPLGGSGDDRIAALERLAALHAQGILTDAELEAEKRRILGG